MKFRWLNLSPSLSAIAPLVLNPAIVFPSPPLPLPPSPRLPPSLSSLHPAPTDLLQQGNEHYQKGQLEAAIQSWLRARKLYQQVKDKSGEGTVLLSLGSAYVSLERYQEAATTLESALVLARSLNDRRGEAQALGNLGIAYEALGKYGRALEAHRVAGRILRSLNDQPGLGQVLLNLGNTLEALGDYDKAKIAYEQSLKIVRQLGDRPGEAIALSNLGVIYANLEEYQRAIATFEASLTIAQAIDNRSSVASALINLGSTYHSLSIGNKNRMAYLTQAVRSYQQALDIARKAQDRKHEGEALGSLGLAYEDLKDYPKAIAYQRQSLAIARASGKIEAQGIALNNLGHALFGAGRLKDAETQLRQAITLLDALRPGLSDTYKVSIFDTQIHTYSLLQQILIAANQVEAALEAAEQGRARAFVELLAQRSQEARVQSQETGIRMNLKPPLPRSSFSTAQSIGIAGIKQVAHQQNATLVEYAIVPDDDFKFRGKQRARESELFIWVVQPTGKVTFRRVDLKPLWQKNVTLSDVVQVARCLVPGGNCGPSAQAIRELGGVDAVASQTNPISSSQPRIRKQAGLRKLHDLLIQPIADLLPRDPNARITFIPQDSLFLAPFAALQDSNGKYLIEQHTILTAPSIQVLEQTHYHRLRQAGNLLSQSPHPMQTLFPPAHSLIVGNPTMPLVSLEAGQPPMPLPPLPGAEQEAIKIATLLRAKALIGSAATKAIVKQQLPQARMVHLATHGLLEYGSRNGQVSLQGLGVPGAIALAPSPGHLALVASVADDGLLTANEILDMRLNADLVVLSACDTGQGRITGDGVIGLSRAFILAGVPSVVVSLWAVPDAPTARLMTTFYQALLQQPNQQQLDKARALRLAMLDTMQTYPRPRDWAAFILIGEP